jgi:hypothetical protein
MTKDVAQKWGWLDDKGTCTNASGVSQHKDYKSIRTMYWLFHGALGFMDTPNFNCKVHAPHPANQPTQQINATRQRNVCNRNTTQQMLLFFGIVCVDNHSVLSNNTFSKQRRIRPFMPRFQLFFRGIELVVFMK